jgi:hypothetical protein
LNPVARMRPLTGLQLAHEVAAHAPLTGRLPRDQAVPFQPIEPSHVGLDQVGGRSLSARVPVATDHKLA